MNELSLTGGMKAESRVSWVRLWRKLPALDARTVVGAMASTSAVVTVLGVLLYFQNGTSPGTREFFDPVTPVVALLAVLVGTVITFERPSNPVGWLLCGTVLASFSFFAEQYGLYALVVNSGSLPAGRWMAWLASWVWLPGLLPLTTLLLLLFPEGRLPGRRWRPVAWGALLSIAVGTACAALAPASAGSLSAVNPVGLETLPQLSGLMQAAVGVCIFLLAPLCLAGLVARSLGATPEVRGQLRWFVRAAVVAVAAPVCGMVVSLGMYQAAGFVGLLGLSAGAMVGIVRHGLYGISRSDINRFSSQAVVYAGLTVAAAGIYWITDLRLPSLVAAVVTVVACQPLRKLLQEAVEHLLSPRRAYHALIQLGDCLESGIVTDDVLPAMAGTIAASLDLAYVAVEVGDEAGTMAAAVHGEAREDVTVMPLLHRHQVVGQLTVAPRPGRELYAADLHLLRDLAGQAGAAVHTVQLTADLRRSKERLVSAREEEWRRLRRELHDRLGPLGGIQHGVAAAGNLLATGDIASAQSLLGRLKSELRSETADIRALIDRLRPRALDQFGLVGALQRQATMSALSRDRLTVTVEASGIEGLSAAVEVAAYHIVLEALTNARRHAQARHCRIGLAVEDGWLELEVTDDGVGLPPGFREGVGISGMRERAVELGGSCGVEDEPSGGTRVHVEIPLGDG